MVVVGAALVDVEELDVGAAVDVVSSGSVDSTTVTVLAAAVVVGSASSSPEHAAPPNTASVRAIAISGRIGSR